MIQQQKTRVLMQGALFCAVTAVASQLIIPLAPVPLSLSLVAVYLTGTLLTPKIAFWAQMAYLLLGAAGAPIFSGFTGGPAKLLGPTGGYLLAYPLMAWLVSWFAQKWGRGLWKYSASMVLALLLCYILGTVWLMVSTGNSLAGALAVAVVPFVPLDLGKIAGSAVLSVMLYSRLSRMALTC